MPEACKPSNRLLDMPMEMVVLVLFWAAKMRGMPRALRLRLVCKTFDIAFYPALFETRLLDSYQKIGTLSWRINTQHPAADLMWHAYLVRRTLCERDPKVGRYHELRTVAQTARREMQEEAKAGVSVPELREVVERLCWFLLRQAVCPTFASWRQSWGPNGSDTDIDTHGRENRPRHTPAQLRSLTLLSAAAYLNLHSLAQRLLDDGHDPEGHGRLLASAMQAAAQAGNTAMLRRLRHHQPIFHLGPNPPRMQDGNAAIIGAAIRGDMQLLREVLTHEPRPLQPMFISLWHRVGERAYASTAAIYDCIADAFPQRYAESLRRNELERYAELGNVVMVEHLIKLGVPFGSCKMALRSACRGGHLNVVLLLIEHGADARAMDIHQAATITHSLPIARLLLRAGAAPNLTPRSIKGLRVIRKRGHLRGPSPYDTHQSDGDDDTVNASWVSRYRARRFLVKDDVISHGSDNYPAIVHAFYREHIPLIHLLVRYDAIIPDKFTRKLARDLTDNGYDSMLALLSEMCGWDHWC